MKIDYLKRFIFASCILSNIFLHPLFGQAEKKEIEIEIKRLENLKKEIEKIFLKNQELLKKIEKEKKEIFEAKKNLEKIEKEIKKERFKKLAKDFEGMEPEMAGEKLSKMDDAKKAAYILYNMKAKSAGEALNFVDAKRVSEIVKILTELKKKK